MPLSLLKKHARAKDSGEIIVAAEDGLEVHVYLLEGRVAWATSSIAPNTLTTYLIKECGVEKAALREVVEECRRTNARFGDTLIAWSVASPEQVQAALRAQIAEALSTLVGVSSDRSIFLPRQLDYSPELTFDADEVVPAGAAAAEPAAAAGVAAPARARPTPPPTPPSGHKPAAARPAATPASGQGATKPSPQIQVRPTTPPRPATVMGRPAPIPSRSPQVPQARAAAAPAAPAPAASDPEVQKKILRTVENALPTAIWTRVIGPAEVPDTAPGDSELRRAARAMGSYGATAVTLRSVSGTILGHVASSNADWAFCGFPSGANVVRASAVLSRALEQSGPMPAAAPPPRSSPLVEDKTLGSMLTPIRALMRQTEEMLAGLVLRMNAAKYVGANQGDTKLDALADIAAGCVAAAPLSLSPYFPAEADGQPETVTVSVETAPYWHFGSVLSGESELFLWLVLAPQTPRGAGRVLLKKLIRQLGDEEMPSVTGLWPSSFDSSPYERRPAPPPAPEAPAKPKRTSSNSSAFDEVRYEDEEVSSVYEISPIHKRGKPPQGGSGAFG